MNPWSLVTLLYLGGSSLSPEAALILSSPSRTGRESLSALSVAGAGVSRVARISQAGPIELVWDWESQHDLSSPVFRSTNGKANTLDGPVRFFKDASGGIFGIASNAVNYRIPFNADFSPQRRLTAADRIFDSSVTYASGSQFFHVGNGSGYLSGSCSEADYDNLIWIFGLWTSDGRNFSALAHHEFYTRSCPVGSTSGWVNAVHHLTSKDGGASFLPKAYTPYARSGRSNADRLVLVPRPAEPGDPGKITYGFYHPSNIVREGAYHYATATAQISLGTTNAAGEALVDGGFVMIRTTDPGQPTGWEVYTDRGWETVSSGAFAGGPGGQDVKLFFRQSAYSPYSAYPSGGQNMTYSLVQHERTGKWIAFGYSNQGATTVQYSTSDSLENPGWDPIQPVEGAPLLPANGYPSLVDHGARGFVFQAVGDEPYLYFVAPNNASYVPATMGQRVTDPHSRSIWRMRLKIESDGAGSAPVVEAPIPAGLFKVGPGIFYSNGAAYCYFGSMPSFTALTGRTSAVGIAEYPRVPGVMRNDGICGGSAPAPAAPPVAEISISEGLFRIGVGLYYSNGSAYCHFPDMPTFTALTGKTSAAGIVAYSSIPSVMHDAGSCRGAGASPSPAPSPAPEPAAPMPVGLFKVGAGIFYSNGSAYCQFGSMASFTTLTGKTSVVGIPEYPAIPALLRNDGICGGG